MANIIRFKGWFRGFYSYLYRMKNTKCIYAHKKPSGEVFYIGIGNSRRPRIKGHRNPMWKNIVNKLPFYEVTVLKNNIGIEEAIELEKILISWYGRRDLGLGTLCNMTDGGDGVKNLSEEVRLKNTTRKFTLTKEQAEDLYINKNMSLSELSSFLNLEISCVKKNFKRLGVKKDEKLRSDNLSRNFNRTVIPNASKKVIDSVTMKIYQSVAVASKELGIAESTLRHQLLGTYPSKTNLIFLK